jgi:hypothetical protein
MRTAVVRVNVDPAARLVAAQLRGGMATLVELAGAAGATVIEVELAVLPAGRRHVEVLIAGDDPDELTRAAVALCAKAFGGYDVAPTAGVLTYVSRGTDDDAYGVLAGLGLHGEIERIPGGADGPGWDTVNVTLRKADLERVPESRVHTALEASLNCEVHIRTR